MKLKCRDLVKLGDKDLMNKVDDLRKELWNYRVTKVTNPSSMKLNKMKHVRKNIARCLVVYNQRRHAKAREEYKGKKYIPKQLRPKIPRRQRVKIPQKYSLLRPRAVMKRRAKFPMRTFAVKSQ